MHVVGGCWRAGCQRVGGKTAAQCPWGRDSLSDQTGVHVRGVPAVDRGRELTPSFLGVPQAMKMCAAAVGRARAHMKDKGHLDCCERRRRRWKIADEGHMHECEEKDTKPHPGPTEGARHHMLFAVAHG